jgi:HSP20 family molecular chaperone IbpA
MNKSLSKIYNLNKLLQLRSAVNSLSSANKLISTTSVNNRNALSKWFRDDDYFGSANSLMRSLEREFDNVRRQMERNVFDVDSSLLRFPVLSALERTKDDFIIVDKDGNRRFQMQFDLKGFEPEEIQLRTEGQNLMISAKKEKMVSFILN